MADRAKKISELPAASSISTTDVFLIVANTAGTATNKTVTANTLYTAVGGSVRGPYASDAAAAAANVAVGSIYYNASGVVHVRLT